jgi:hypothetical protein
MDSRMQTALCIVLLCCVLLIPAFVFPSPTPDWPSFYAGAKLVTRGSAELYSFQASQRITGQFEDPTYVWAFVRPPIYAAALSPLGALPPRAAFAVWELLNVAAVIGFVFLVDPSLFGLVMTALFIPLGLSFRQGQDMPFWLLFIGLSMVLLRRNRGFAAGLVLALCGIKFHLFLLLPVFLLARRASRMAAGLCIGGVLLIVGCFALFGRDWPSQYYTCIVENQKHLPSTGSFLALVSVPWWPVVVCVAVGALCYAVCRFVKSPEAALSSAVALSLLIAPRFYLYDAVIALPAFLLIFRRLLYAPESEQFQMASAKSEMSQDLDALAL